MTAMITSILVAGLVSMIVVIAHEIAEHDGMPTLPHPGADEQWAELLGVMRRQRDARERRRAR